MRRVDRRTALCLAALTLAAVLAGCGDDDMTAAEREKVRAVVEQGLTAWHKGEPARNWAGRNAPVVFDDFEWKAKFKLLEYRIDAIRRNPDGHPEALVTLKLQPPRGQPVEKTALYGVNFRSDAQTAVGRDPMF